MRANINSICSGLVNVGRKNDFCKYIILAVLGFLWFATVVKNTTKQLLLFTAHKFIGFFSFAKNLIKATGATIRTKAGTLIKRLSACARWCKEQVCSLWSERKKIEKIPTNKIISVVLSTCMLLSVISTTVHAENTSIDSSNPVITEDDTVLEDNTVLLPEKEASTPEGAEVLAAAPLAEDAITIRINKTSTPDLKGSDLKSAIGSIDLSTIAKLYIRSGVFTEDDWRFLQTLPALTYFDANHSSISSIADIPEQVSFPATIKNVFVSKLQTVKPEYFAGCTELEQCCFYDATTIEEMAFYARTKLSRISFPKVEAIGAYAFFATGITEATFPKVKSIGEKGKTDANDYSFIFTSCNHLKNVKFEIAEYIEQNSFENCVKLETAIFPMVKEIGSSAFQNTSAEGMSLSSADFQSVEKIGANAFEGCTKLKSLTLPTTPPKVDDINAFYKCPAAREIKWIDQSQEATAKSAYRAVDDGNSNDDVWYGWPLRTNPITVIMTDTAGVVEDPISALNLKFAVNKHGISLAKVAKLEIIGGTVTAEDWKWLAGEGKSATLAVLKEFTISGGTIVADLPNSSNNSSPFSEALEKVSMKNIEKLGNQAFKDCTNLTSASFPDTTEIGVSAFQYCDKLESVDFPKLQKIGGFAFQPTYDGSALKNVSFPEVTDIEGSAFNRCVALETVSFPKATFIGKEAFYNCTSLKAISFPQANWIWDKAFQDCTSLESAEFARENLAIEGQSTRANIGIKAFDGCTSLKTIKFGSKTPPKVENADAFTDCPATRWLELADDEAINAYDNDTTNSNTVNDGKWYGWSVKQPKVIYSPVTQDQIDNVFGEGGATFTEPNKITLEKDIILTETIEVSTDIVLDLNGHTITGPSGKDNAASPESDGKPAIKITENDVDVTIENSGKAAEIIGGNGGDGGDTNKNGGNGGTAIDASGTTGGTITADDKVTITGGNGGSATVDETNVNGGDGGNGANVGSDTVVSGDGTASGGNGGNVPGDNGTVGSPGKGVQGGTEDNITIKQENGKKGFKITTEVKLEGLPPGTTVTVPSKDLADAVVTQEDKDKSLDIKVNLNVAPSKTLESERTYINSVLAELSATTVGDSFDITLEKIVTTDGAVGEPIEVKNAEQEILITIGIPTAMLGGSNYTVIRVHGTNATALPTTELDDKLTFKSDKFSTYSIAYTPKANAEQEYSLTVNGVTTKQKENDLISIDAGSKSGYTFTGWTSLPAIDAFGDASKPLTTFKMPAKDTTVTANWKANSSDNVIYYPSYNGSTSSEPEAAVPQVPNMPTTAQAVIKEEVDKKGNSTAVISESEIKASIENAKADALKKGKQQDGISLSVIIGTGENKVNSNALKLEKAALELLINNQIESITLNLATSKVQATLDLDAIKSIYAQAKSDVLITITTLNEKNHKGDAKAAIGSRPSYQLTATYENGKQRILVFGGSMSLEIPYTIQKSEQAGNVFLVSVDKNSVKWIDYSSYNQKRETLVGLVSTFTEFGVGYKSDTFKEVQNDDVIFVKSRKEISSLMDKLFPSDKAITREQAAVIIANYAKTANFSKVMPVTRDSITFTDISNISTSAASDVLSMQQAGILMAKSAKLFCPQQTATESELAAMMRRYTELIINKKTTEGFHRNDSEQWMYFANGKAVTGTHTINGVAYEFDSDGIMLKANDTSTSAKKFGVYTVKKGDWVSKIAIKYGCTTQDIVELNNIKNPNLIYAGQQFIVPLN